MLDIAKYNPNINRELSLEEIVGSLEDIKGTITKIIQWIKDKVKQMLDFVKNIIKQPNKDIERKEYENIKSKCVGKIYETECHIDFTIHMYKWSHYLLYIASDVKVNEDDFSYEFKEFIDKYISHQSAAFGGYHKNVIDKVEDLKEGSNDKINIKVQNNYSNFKELFSDVDYAISKYEKFIKTYAEDLEYKQKSIKEIEIKIEKNPNSNLFERDLIDFKRALSQITTLYIETTKIYKTILIAAKHTCSKNIESTL